METLFEEKVSSELKSMDQRLYDMEEKINSIDTKLSQVIDAILGNPLTKTGGFIHEVSVLKNKINELEAKLEKQEEFKKRITWTFSIIIAIGVLIQYLTRLYLDIK